MNRLPRPLRSALLTTTGALVLALPAVPAAAQSPLPTPTPTPTPPPAAPAPAPAPASGKLSVAVKAPLRDGRRKLALQGSRVRVNGTLKPYVAGQEVTVRVWSGRHKLAARKAAVKPGKAGRGAFSVRIRLDRPGSLAIRASHERTPELRARRSKAAHLLVVRPSASYGSRGPLVRIFQRRLRALRYGARVTGRYDDATGRAVMAWRKVNGRSRVYSADSGVVRGVLAGRGGWKVRHPGAGHHVEADISLQALALIDGDRVQHVYHTSSGAPATPTVRGAFRFYSKTPGTNAKGMVDASYFIGGYAIHGYVSVPAYNASHGCLRVPIPEARGIFNWIRLGDRIFVES